MTSFMKKDLEPEFEKVSGLERDGVRNEGRDQVERLGKWNLKLRDRVGSVVALVS